jgi:arylsulfatase A-like enzyme
MSLIRTIWLGLLASSVAVMVTAAPASAQQQKPNILVIMGDDIGYWNISAYNRGMMGYRTPNIDRIANEGAIFTDYYGQQSCTAGRAAFITGQSPLRTGLLKVGLPGAKEGLSEKDPTLAELLKPQGYVTGQFGKNHLGDRNEFLPTVHGFDEFFGNLYHLNAEDGPRAPRLSEEYGVQAALRAQAGTRSRSSPGSTQPACISGPDLSPSRRKRPVLDFIRMAWWNMTRRLASC